MPNPNKRSRRRERRRKVARRVAGKVLASEAAQQVVSKGAGAVASIYGTPAAGLVVSRGLEKAMEAGAGRLATPKTKRGKKAAKKIAKKARRETAKAARTDTMGIIGAPPISYGEGTTFGPKPGEVVEEVTEELFVGDGGELIQLPAPAEEERPLWMNPLYLAAAAAAAFFLLRKK